MVRFKCGTYLISRERPLSVTLNTPSETDYEMALHAPPVSIPFSDFPFLCTDQIITLSAPTGCDYNSDCILIVTKSIPTIEQHYVSVNQLSSKNRFGVQLKGHTDYSTVLPHNTWFDFSFVIFKLP